MIPNFNTFELNAISKIQDRVYSNKRSGIEGGTIFVPLDYPLHMCLTSRCRQYIEMNGYKLYDNFGGVNVTY